MSILLPILLLLVQQFTCVTAASHAHTVVRDARIEISSWSGCELRGTIGTTQVQLWAESGTCGLRTKVPGTFNVRYDAACGQVLELTDGPLSPACPAPKPTPAPLPVETPIPTPTKPPSPDNTRIPSAAEIVDAAGNVWTLSGARMLRNGVETGGFGSALLLCKGRIYGKGEDAAWWEFTGTGWARLGSDPCAVATPTPTATPSPTPSPTVKPSPSPLPSPSPTPTRKPCKFWQFWKCL